MKNLLLVSKTGQNSDGLIFQSLAILTEQQFFEAEEHDEEAFYKIVTEISEENQQVLYMQFLSLACPELKKALIWLVENKNSINDDYANDGDGRFDIWKTSKLEQVIETIENFLK